MLLALLALLLTGCGNAEPKTAESEVGAQSTDDAAALPDTTCLLYTSPSPRDA